MPGDVKLTAPQRRMLNWLQCSPGRRSQHGMNGAQIGMLRRMEERGLVGRNSHDQWHITAAGRRVLQGDPT